MKDIYDAITMTLDAHKDQVRKLDGDLYAAHPLEVAILVSSIRYDEELLIAAVLHDTVEDTTLTIHEIRKHFGKRIADLVLGCSELDKSLPWKERKIQALFYLANEASEDVKIIVLADKLSNIKSIHRNMQESGDDLWDLFNAGYDEQKWYFKESLKALSSLSDLDLYRKFEGFINQVFNK